MYLLTRNGSSRVQVGRVGWWVRGSCLFFWLYFGTPCTRQVQANSRRFPTPEVRVADASMARSPCAPYEPVARRSSRCGLHAHPASPSGDGPRGACRGSRHEPWCCHRRRLEQAPPRCAHDGVGASASASTSAGQCDDGTLASAAPDDSKRSRSSRSARDGWSSSPAAPPTVRAAGRLARS